MQNGYGFLSLVPPLVAIALAATTRNVIVSLFFGLWLGVTVLNGWNPVAGFVESIDGYLLAQAGDDWNASILILMLTIGGFVGVLERSGGATAFVRTMTRFVTNRVRAHVAVWVSGIAIFFSDSANPLILGPLFTPLFDKLRISREKLAYLVDSTASPVSVLVPVTSWGAFIVTLVAKEMEGLGLADDPMAMLLRAFPFQLYAISSLVLVLVVGVLGLDFGPMRAAEARVATTGKVLPDGAKPLRAAEGSPPPTDEGTARVIDMALPVLTLFSVLATMLLWRGGFPEASLVEALGKGASVVPSVSTAFLTAAIVGGVLLMHRGVAVDACVQAWVKGASSIVAVLVILLLAWSLGACCKQLGTAAYVAGAVEHVANPWLIPSMVFLAGGVVSFATGSAWGCYAILLPIALPLAHACGASLPVTLGAVLSGGLFGDHCSPISDTTILASLGAACDHVDHVRTQAPYAAVAAAASAVGYVLAAATESAWSILGTLTLMVLIVAVLRRAGRDRHGAPAPVSLDATTV